MDNESSNSSENEDKDQLNFSRVVLADHRGVAERKANKNKRKRSTQDNAGGKTFSYTGMTRDKKKSLSTKMLGKISTPTGIHPQQHPLEEQLNVPGSTTSTIKFGKFFMECM